MKPHGTIDEITPCGELGHSNTTHQDTRALCCKGTHGSTAESALCALRVGAKLAHKN